MRAISQLKNARGHFIFSSLTIGISLFVLLLIATLLFNFHRMTSTANRNVVAIAFLAVQDEEEAKQVNAQVSNLSPHVTTELVSPSEALQKAQGKAQSNWRSLLDPDFAMPWVLVVHSRIDDIATNQSFFNEIESLPQIGELVRPGDEMRRARWAINLFYGAGIIVAILLCVLVVVLVTNAIRLSVLRRLAEIKIMRLVGATETFIRMPFVIEGCLLGLVGCVCAFLFMSAFHFLSSSFTNDLLLGELEVLRLETVPWWVFAGVGTFGCLLGAFGSFLSTFVDYESEWSSS